MGSMKGGFLAMVVSVLGVVLYVTMFSTVLTAFESLRTHTNIDTFTALSTVVEIAPTVLLLAGIFAAGFGYYKGYKATATGGTDTGGLMRMVLGVLVIILFVTLFSTIVTAMYTLYTADNADQYTAFQTVVQIAPTVLFLAGVFAGGATAAGGYSARRKSKKQAV